MREFRKIKFDNSTGLVLTWDTPTEDPESTELYESSFKSKKHKPHAAFIKALKNLAQDVPVMCEFPDDLYSERIRVNGVSISLTVDSG